MAERESSSIYWFIPQITTTASQAAVPSRNVSLRNSILPGEKQPSHCSHQLLPPRHALAWRWSRGRVGLKPRHSPKCLHQYTKYLHPDHFQKSAFCPASTNGASQSFLAVSFARVIVRFQPEVVLFLEWHQAFPEQGSGARLKPGSAQHWAFLGADYFTVC